MKTTTVLLCGVGGQGTILAADILAKTAAASGLQVKLSEIHGMSQRGGSVTTVVRFGDEVASMVCDLGTTDRIVAFEEIEALRNLPYLAEDGTLLGYVYFRSARARLRHRQRHRQPEGHERRAHRCAFGDPAVQGIGMGGCHREARAPQDHRGEPEGVPRGSQGSVRP